MMFVDLKTPKQKKFITMFCNVDMVSYIGPTYKCYFLFCLLGAKNASNVCDAQCAILKPIANLNEKMTCSGTQDTFVIILYNI